MGSQRVPIGNPFHCRSIAVGAFLEDGTSLTRGYKSRTVFFCFKEYDYGKPGRTMHEGREVTGSGQYSAVKNHCVKVGRTLYKEGEVIGLGH